MITESIESLQKFTLFSAFNDVQCNYIRNNATQLIIPAKKVLLKQGIEHNILFILLKGKLKLIARDGKEEIIKADSKRATDTIAQIRPSLYKVTSLTQVKILALSEEVLGYAEALKQSSDSNKNVEQTVINSDNISPSHTQNPDKILIGIMNQLHHDQLVLPSMPDIALKIRHAIEDEESDLNDVIKVINMDQSIATKIINTANSAMYNTSGKKIETCKTACMRLGGKMIKNLVLAYAVKKIFHIHSPLYKNKMDEMWQHSVKVAAVSSILARLTPGFDSEKALLAGLLHNIGPVAILNYLSEENIQVENTELLHNILFTLQAEVGERLLTKWQFSDDLIEVVKHSTNMFHNENKKANYIDIVNIAQIHAYIGTPYQEKLPIINQIPAFEKLALGQLTPELSIKVLNKSQAEIDQTIALFN